MTSTNTKLLLASTALVSAISVAGVAKAADTVLPATGAITGTNNGSLTHTDTNSNTNIDAGETVATNAAITFAAGDNIDVSGATGVSLTIGHNLTGNGSAGAPLIDLGTANNIVTINSGVTLAQTHADAAADGINITAGAGNTINVNGTISHNAAAEGIHVSGDVTSTINVSSTGNSGDIDFSGVTTATNTSTLNVTGGTVGAVDGGAGVDVYTVSGSNQSNIGNIALGAANDTITLSGTDSAATVLGTVAGDAGTDTLTVTSGTNTIGAISTLEDININGGTSTIASITGMSTFDVANGATVTVSGATTGASVTVAAGGTLTQTGAATGITESLTVAGDYFGGAATTAAKGINVTSGRLYNTGVLTATAGGLTVGSTAAVSVTGNTVVTAGGLSNSGTLTTGGTTTVTAGDYVVAGTHNATGLVDVEAGNATISGTASLGNNLVVDGANSLLTVANGGNLTVTGNFTGVSATVAAGGTADFKGTYSTTGNIVVNGTATFGDAVTDDSTATGALTVGSSAVARLNADLTGVTALSVASGANFVVAAGALLEADTGVSSLENITLELTDTINTSGRVTFSGEQLAPTGAPVKLTVAQGVTISDGQSYNQIITGNAAPSAIAATSNALYTYTWTVDTNSYDLTVNLRNAGVTTLTGAVTGANNKGIATTVDSTALASLYSDVMAQSDTESTLESLTPDVSGGAGAASINTTVASTGTVSNRLALLRGTDNGRSGMVAGQEMMANREMWIQAFGTTVDQDERKGVKGFDATTSGLAIGADTDELVHGARVGVAFSYATADVDSDQSNNAQTDIDTYQLTAYGSKDLANDMYVDAMVSYAWNEHEGSRTDFLGDTYTSDYDGAQFSVKGEVGKAYDWANTRVTPNVGLHYINVETDGYNEAGAGGNGLNVDTDDQQALLLSIGSDIEWNFTGRDGSEYMPYLRASYSYDLMGDEVETTSTFLAGGTAFKSEGADIARSSLGLGAGVNVVTTKGFEFTAGYDAEIKEDFLAHTGMLQARWSF